MLFLGFFFFLGGGGGWGVRGLIENIRVMTHDRKLMISPFNHEKENTI